MFIQKCKNCSKEFTWKSINKSIWNQGFIISISCDNCKTKHHINISSRILFIALIVLPAILETRISTLISNNRILHESLIAIAWFSLLIFIFPFIARYHVKK